MKACLSAVIACMAALAVMVTVQSAPAQGNKLEGVWKVVEVTITGPNASTNSNPQPGFFMFTKKHYSMTYITGDTAPHDLPRNATDAQKTAAWKPFEAYAGEYEIKGATVMFRAKVCKNQAALKPDSGSVQDLRIEDNTMWLTIKIYNDRPVTNPTTTKLVRVE